MVSKYHFLPKGANPPWRNDGFQVCNRKIQNESGTSWFARKQMRYQRLMELCQKNTGTMMKGFSLAYIGTIKDAAVHEASNV